MSPNSALTQLKLEFFDSLNIVDANVTTNERGSFIILAQRRCLLQLTQKIKLVKENANAVRAKLKTAEIQDEMRLVSTAKELEAMRLKQLKKTAREVKAAEKAHLQENIL